MELSLAALKNVCTLLSSRPPSPGHIRGLRGLWFVVACLFVWFLFISNTKPSRPTTALRGSSQGILRPSVSKPPEVALVIASLKHENTTWMNDALLDWSKSIYFVDDPDASLTTPLNKGREAMVYLTYVIEH